MFNYQLIFCHGFGLSPRYWDKLAPLFTDAHQTFWDLGYFSSSKRSSEVKQDKPLIGIGHSLGMLKLMEASLNFQAIIGLNAFTSFLGHDPRLRRRRVLELEQMQTQFKHQPELTLKAFYQRAGLAYDVYPHLNLTSLQDDLDYLKYSQPDKKPKTKLLIIGSEDDLVAPPQLIRDNCTQMPQLQSIFLPYGKHSLGYNHTNEIYTLIRDYIDGL